MARGIDVIALGGNAIIPKSGSGTIEEQRELTSATMKQVAQFILSGRNVVLTHGNGPIVGNIMERNEAVKDHIPPMPLDICGADSQGGIGYMIQQSLLNELQALGTRRNVVSVVSQVIVDEKDDAFNNPTKPIGPFYYREKAEELKKTKGWEMREDADRGGYRRVVPSPKPIEIVELDAIMELMKAGVIVIAVGGGGIPVVKRDGKLFGVEAVVDKDRAAALLARMVGAERLIILTSVPEVYIGFGGDEQKPIRSMTASEAKKLYEKGEFPPGSMGPKIEAAIDFLANGGKEVIISEPTMLIAACNEGAGTHIFP